MYLKVPTCKIEVATPVECSRCQSRARRRHGIWFIVMFIVKFGLLFSSYCLPLNVGGV